MNFRSLFFSTLCLLAVGTVFTACEDDDDDSCAAYDECNCLRIGRESVCG